MRLRPISIWIRRHLSKNGITITKSSVEVRGVFGNSSWLLKLIEQRERERERGVEKGRDEYI